MRAFIVRSDTAYIDEGEPPFKAGRLDVMLNSAISAITHGNAQEIRRDVEFFMVMPLNDPPIIHINASTITRAPINEEDMLSLLLSGLRGRERGVRGMHGSLDSLLNELQSRGYFPIYLHEDGAPIKSIRPRENMAFILGNQNGMPISDESMMRKRGVRKVSLGPLPYMTWECVAIINAMLDGRILLA